MQAVMFRCPRARIHTHVMLPKRETEEDAQTFEVVKCPACQGMHMLNRASGDILGEPPGGTSRS